MNVNFCAVLTTAVKKFRSEKKAMTSFRSENISVIENSFEKDDF